MMRVRLIVAAGMAWSICHPAAAQVISAEAVATVYDLASPEAIAKATGGKPPSSQVQKAADLLRRDQLLLPSRVSTQKKPGVLQRWGDALLMGTRAPQFASEIAAVRDAVVRGATKERHDAIMALFKKAGRNPPTPEALKDIDQKLDNALADEPEESVRNTVDKPDHKVEISYVRRAGDAAVDVTTTGEDGKPERTVFRGQEQTRPTADGKDLEVKIEPTGTCTMGQQQSDDRRGRLNGRWSGSDGNEWTISGSGGSLTAVEKRPNGHTLTYTGTYEVGKVSAFHGFTDVRDMGEELPADVRSQLVGWSPKLGFTIRFDLCGTNQLKGTWSSQSVTYSGMSHKVESVHDPYDVPLVLSRGLAMARGGRFPEDGP